ncbi:MAG: histidine kinase [Ruminococcus sp.]|nr:histidine kinase [Ruminococcus sp.]
MKKLLGGKTWSGVLIGIVALILIGLGILGSQFFTDVITNVDVPMFLEGEYSVDGGEWKPIDNTREVTDSFHTIVFKGRLIDELKFGQSLTFSTKNVWYSLYDKDNETLTEYMPIDVKKNFETYLQFANEESFGKNYDDFDLYVKEYFGDRRLASHYPDTPGYRVQDAYFNLSGFDDPALSEEYTLTVTYPYDTPTVAFNDCFDAVLCENNQKYLDFFYKALPSVLLFVLVCFFGLFFFPIASFILGRADEKYFMFGAMTFSWGLFMIMQSTSGYLNMWITDPTVCLLLHQLTNYVFIATILLYLKSNLVNMTLRMVAGITAALYLLAVIAVTVLHFCGVSDIYASSAYMFIATAACSLITAGMLLVDTKNNKQAAFFLGSWIPLAVTIIIDAVNHFVNFTDFAFYNVGLTITMVYQFIRLVLDLRTQYKEAIRYQKMQKELYEAKVGVMVSQIQPHFMYNALSSIAMLCKINPDTAYEATINFSEYLRGNMDSLKQQAPVPFTKELDHLKKYLYIEQLRFGKKLNIVYDINETDFVLPQLSIQPLVENAVKHGVGMKKKGGTVTISTHETDDAYEVIISDDGVGFDTTAPKKDDGRSPVGMDNTKRRIKELCGGQVVIESVVGEGTTAKVILPKEGQNHENTVR